MAIKNLKWDHPLLHDLYDTYITSVIHNQKSVMFCWVPSHVGIQGNERVDALAKLALNEPYTNIKIPYADLCRLSRAFVRRAHPNSVCRLHIYYKFIF